MSLFGFNYTKPGPGVDKNAPRKKGLARTIELLGRDFGDYWKAGFLFGLCCLPAAFCIYSAAATGALVFVLAGGVCSALAGPTLTALYDTVLRTLRDEPGYWWHVYKRAYKRSFKASLLPGAVTGLLIGLEVYCFSAALSTGQFSAGMLLALLLSVFVLTAVCSSFWPQLALLELPNATLLRNSVLLFFAFFPRAALAAMLQLLYWGLIALFVPVSLLPFCVTGFWLPVLAAGQAIYPALDKSFSIETTLAQQRETRSE
ncbi:MAG: DUF624 domain-containing protein [Faecalibacterium sp.]|nr:DUF624 domain-containing protein [Faecalibacterium sp.]